MLTKGFLRKKHELVFDKSRILKSVLVGLFASLFIYSFLCGLRLYFRTWDISFSNGPYLLSETSRYWQNVNFALVSFAIGNTGFIRAFFKSPSLLKIPNYKRYAILVDQVFLPYNFAHLFFKLFFFMSFMSMMSIDLGHFEVYTYLFLTISIVLFMECYKTIVRIYRINAYKMIGINLLVIMIGVFSIANTSIFDYQKIDDLLLANNPKVELPMSMFRDFNTNRNASFIKIYKESKKTVYTIDGSNIALDSIPILLLNKIRNEYNTDPFIYLLISRDLPLEEVFKIQSVINEKHFYKIIFVVKEKGDVNDRFDMRGVYHKSPLNWKEINHLDKTIALLPIPPYERCLIKTENIIGINIKANGFIDFEGERVKSLNALVALFKNNFDEKIVFNFIFDAKAISFQDYITVYSSYRIAIDDLRNDYLKEIGRPYFEQDNRDYDVVMKELKSKFPIQYTHNYILEDTH